MRTLLKGNRWILLKKNKKRKEDTLKIEGYDKNSNGWFTLNFHS